MDKIRIGKSAINEVVISNDNTVSRSHAELIIENGVASIVDLNSTNGTFVNGNRIYGTHKLKELDIVRIGKHPFNWSRYIDQKSYDNQFPEDSKYTIVEGDNNEPKTQPRKPDNYLVESILATVFCCIPFGVVGIVYAAQVGSLYAAGDYDGANEASSKASYWAKTSFWTGVVVIVLYFLFVFGLSV